MKLIVGLGNPDKKYLKTRHNVGYMAVDAFVEHKNLHFTYDFNFLGSVAKYNNGKDKAIFLKPATYMNLSGRSVIKVINYYKINLEDVLIIYDDVDIELGKLRIRYTGGSGGHKGMLNILETLNSQDIKRVRIGIGKELDMVKYVLSKFSKKEKEILNPVIDEVRLVIELFVLGEEFTQIMNKHNNA